jgi:Transposase IS200 like
VLDNAFKGTASRLPRKQRQDIEQRYGDGALWSPSYFAGCDAPFEEVKRYIPGQRGSAAGEARFARPGLASGGVPRRSDERAALLRLARHHLRVLPVSLLVLAKTFASLLRNT